MAWKIEFDDQVIKELQKLDRAVAKRIIVFLESRIAVLGDPRSIGGALTGSKLGEFWRYRLGDYRIIARIEDHKMIVLVLRVGNRKEVYRRGV